APSGTVPGQRRRPLTACDLGIRSGMPRALGASMIKTLWLAIVIAGCSNVDATPTLDAGSSALGVAPGIAEPCGPGGVCASGLTCETYYGVAGSGGPQFETCEL